MMKRFSNIQNYLHRKSISLSATVGLLMAAFSPIYTPQPVNAQSLDEEYSVFQNVTLDDLAENPEAYVGRTVTLRAEPEETDNRYSFKLDDEDGINIFDLDLDKDEVLVLNTSRVPFTAPEDDDMEVQVTGKVGVFTLVEVERELGIDLDPEIYLEYENQPVVYAQSIALAPEPDEVTNNPERFYGQAIAVEGEVDEIYSPRTFTLHDDEPFDGEDLLAIYQGSGQIPEDDTDVVVVGEIRSLPVADIERNYDLDWDDLDLETQIETDYEQQPVLIVREIYPLPE